MTISAAILNVLPSIAYVVPENASASAISMQAITAAITMPRNSLYSDVMYRSLLLFIPA